MDTLIFEQIITEQMDWCRQLLIVKAAEYATMDDRLHNFKVAASLQNIPPKQALAGMLAKHTVSIFDMCRANTPFPMALWNEKITDHINYLLLLKALVKEEELAAKKEG